MRKKRKYQDMSGTTAGEGEHEDAVAQPKKTLAGIPAVQKRITSFLREKGVKKNEKGIKYKGKTIPVSYEDMLDDLSHNYKKNKQI